MSHYARGWMFGALCSMSALAGGWAVAATLARTADERPAPDAPPLQYRDPAPAFDRSTPPMSERLYFEEQPRLIAC